MRSEWGGLRRYRELVLSELVRRNRVIHFDSYTETEKAWIITVEGEQYTFPKSKTVLFSEDKTIEVPRWLYDANYKKDF